MEDDRDEMYDYMDDEHEDSNRMDHRVKKIVYPPRLMVDFSSLGMEALKRYAQFYNLTVRDEHEKDDIAAMVARHFDCSLEVEEDDSIVSFIQRIRNGERNANKRTLSDKERKNNEKKRKKSASRKRQRDALAAAAAVGAGASNGSSSSSSNGNSRESTANSSSHSGSHGGRDSKESANGTSEARSGKSSSSSSSNSASSSSNSHKKKSSSSKKDNDNGEDNELYCICNLPSYGNMIACDGKKCQNPSQWYHLECVGFSDGRHPDTWLCPECDPKGFAAFQSSKKKKSNKQRSKSPGSSK
uniref:PHD-type domain-containing protein n=1 Tax=Globisporangium ultimum (strain ATCC 200006 / CBS 805.95 / DAOM BR144) TaxID=431595 RepID=K3W5X1_GLOUD